MKLTNTDRDKGCVNPAMREGSMVASISLSIIYVNDEFIWKNKGD